MICDEIGALKRGTRILQILSYIYIFYSVYHMYVYLRYISYIIYIIYMYISDHVTVQNMPIAPNLSVKATFFTMTSRSCMTQLIFTSLILHPLPFPLLTLLQPHWLSSSLFFCHTRHTVGHRAFALAGFLCQIQFLSPP